MSEQPSTAKTIFLNALEIPSPEARRAYVVSQCGDDEPLAAEVEALLQHHQELGSFLEPGGANPTAATEARSWIESAGSMIGPYKLLEQIGEGGMGVVFMAEQQEPVRRKVAIKLIKPGMDTRQVIARFEAERQALAVMDHPNIARVLDAGTTPSGHPYFVMELVRGVPVTAYCDEHTLPVRERLELFASLCQAIQHAHTKGIIHRDIKPTNVLITRQDGRPAVKVIDFGVAKAMGQQLTEKTLFTNFAQMIGTPLYMSPEQAEQSGVDIDTRSDIYSLGVLLYELLTGSTPVDAEQLKQAAFDEIRRIIREDEPPTPSARISGSHTLPAIAAHRHTEPARLSKLVRGELDWIVMKALEKDRNRRYETANAFAVDLSHYLNDEPVLACPPSAKYRLGKFARRNRVALTTVSLVSLALVLGTVVSAWQAVRATRAEHVAEAARVDEAKQRELAETRQRDADDARAEAENQRAVADANYQEAKAAVDRYFTLVSESTLLDVPGLQPLRRDLLEAAAQFYEKASKVRTDDPAVLADRAATLLRLFLIYLWVNQPDDAIASMRMAIQIVEDLRQHPRGADHLPKVAGFWSGLHKRQITNSAPRDPAAALMTMNRLQALWSELAEAFPSEPKFQRDLAGILSLIANETRNVGYARKARAAAAKLVHDYPEAPEHREGLALTSSFLAIYLGRQSDEAVELHREAIKLSDALLIESPNSVAYRSTLARVLVAFGTSTDAVRSKPELHESTLRRGVELYDKLVREYPDDLAMRELRATAVAEWMWSSNADISTPTARGWVREAGTDLDLLVGQRPQDRYLRQMLAVYWHCLAEKTFRREDDLLAAKEMQQRALELFRELAHDYAGHPLYSLYAEHVGWSCRNLGEIARRTNQLDEAGEHYGVAAETFDGLAKNQKIPQRDGFYRERLADTLQQKMEILSAAGRADDAEKTGRRVVEIYESLTRDFPKDANYRQRSAGVVSDLAGRLADSGNREQAEETFRQAINRYAELAATYPTDADYPRLRASFQRQLAQLQASGNRVEDAQASYQEAIDSYQKVIAEFPKYADLWRVYHGLAQALAASNRPSEAEAAQEKMIELAPKDAGALNTVAWQLVTSKDVAARNANLAVQLAKQAVALAPRNGMILNTLGVASYRAGNWQDAIDWLKKSLDLGQGFEGTNWIYLAMAYWQLGNKDEARVWQAKAVEWMDANRRSEQLLQFRAEAEELMKEVDKEPDPASDEKTEAPPSN